MFGFLAFRSRIHGVYFAIITQALALSAWLVFNRNETNLGGTNGLTDFKTLLGFRLSDPGTQRGLYILTVLCLGGAYILCRWIINSRAGRVLIAIRDSEQRVRFSGYSPANYKLFVFVVSAALAGLAGMLYVPQVGIITPAQIGVLPSFRNGHLGRGGRTGHASWGDPGCGRSELWAQYFDQLFSHAVALLSWEDCFIAVVLLFPGWFGRTGATATSKLARIRKPAVRAEAAAKG